MANLKPVLILSGVRGDTRRYRSFHPYEQLCLAGVSCVLSHITDPALPRQIDTAGIVIFHRVVCDRYVEGLIDRIHRGGGIVLFDTDDLVFDPAAFRWINSPDFQDPVRAALYQEDMRRYRRTLDLCDGALTSTDYLAGRIEELGKQAWVHPNAFSLEMLALSQAAVQQVKKDPARVVLGYASGTPTHDRDFDLVKPALQSVLGKFQQVELWLAGSIDPGAGWDRFGGRVRRFPLLPWRRLPALQAQFDVNLAPLVTDNPFAQSKSEIKYLEAGLVGVPTLASPTSAFLQAIIPGETGCLASDPAGWEESLANLIADPARRERIGRQAHAAVVETAHPCVRARELVITLNRICKELGRTELSPGEGYPARVQEVDPPDRFLPPGLEAHPTLSEMAWYTLRHRGALTLIKQEWVYFRRAVAPIFPYGSRDLEPEKP